MTKNEFRYVKTSPETIPLAVLVYVRFPLSLRYVWSAMSELARNAEGIVPAYFLNAALNVDLLLKPTSSAISRMVLWVSADN